MDDGANPSATLAELRRSEELNRRLVEAVPGGIVHVSIEGAIVHANQTALRFLGMSYDTITERYANDWEPETLFEDGRPCPVEEYPVTLALMTGERQGPVTIGVRRPDGETRWAVFNAVPLLEQGRTTGAVVMFVDITERKELERRLSQAKTMEAIGRLAGGIAHDFNNLLTVILGNTASLTDMLARDGTPPPELGDIALAAKHASGLTRQLLDFSRRRFRNPHAVRLPQFIDELVPVLDRLAGPEIRVEVEHEERELVVELDAAAFERVLINLTTNARDAMSEGGGIRIVTKPDPNHPRGVALLSFEDDGEGMDEEAQRLAFEPFFSRKFGRGSGLGLATVHSLVSQARGEIVLESTPGRGTRFEIRLPRSHEAPRASGAQPTSAAREGRGNILVVEDEGLVREMVGRALGTMGYAVTLAESGEEALARAGTTTFDLLLTDVRMPGMDGGTLARTLRAKHPDLPVVFMSGYAEGLEPEALSGSVYLPKPFAPADLRRAIAKLMD